MKKYLIPSTLISAVALATPAFADEVNITFAAQNNPSTTANTGVAWSVNGTNGYYVATTLSTDEYFTFSWGALTDSTGAEGTLQNSSQNPLNDGALIPYNTHSYTLSFTFTATEDIEISYIAFQFVADGNGGNFDANSERVNNYTVSLSGAQDEEITSLYSGTVTIYGNTLDEVTKHEGDHYEADYIVIEFDDAISLAAGESITFTLGMTMHEADSDNQDLRAGIEGIDVGVRAVPEPSMFGLMFGLGAIALVATRRRRR